MSVIQKIDLLTGRLADEFRTVKTMVSGSATGDASGLETNAKNLVGAINEVKADLASGLTEAVSEAVSTAVAQVVAAAPESLDTLKEIADVLADNESTVGGLVTVLGSKASSADVAAALELKADASGVYTIAEAEAAMAAAIATNMSSMSVATKIINLVGPAAPYTASLIAPALASIGTVNGYTINLGFGEYREAGPIVVNEKWQLQIVGPQSAGTTAATIKNGLTIQNSNGVRMTRVQVEGAANISSRAGLGLYFEKVQLMGDVTLGGTGGFMMFVDCTFGANVTISPSFAGTAYFINCSFAAANGVYTFNQTSPLQAICMDCTGVPNAGIAKASFSGVTNYKNGSQALFLNGVAVLTAGATSGQVLKFNGTAFVPAADNTPDVNKAYVDSAVQAVAAQAADQFNGAVATLAANVYTIAQADAATSSAVSAAVNDLIGAAPGTLDTLGEIAAVMADDQDAAAALAQVVAGKADASDVYTKLESDVAAALKADKADTYTKAEVDAALSEVATDLVGSINAVAADLGDLSADFVAAFEAALIA